VERKMKKQEKSVGNNKGEKKRNQAKGVKN